MSSLTERYCMICDELITTERFIVRLSEQNKFNYEIIGHRDCTDRLHTEIKALKNLNKLPVSKVLQMVNLELNLDDIKV
ncbi:hypothetical protein [Psychrobacillus phage Perkons]|nr:hypothetical protein [Psychrobacillus phage Perkons]